MIKPLCEPHGIDSIAGARQTNIQTWQNQAHQD